MLVTSNNKSNMQIIIKESIYTFITAAHLETFWQYLAKKQKKMSIKIIASQNKIIQFRLFN